MGVKQLQFRIRKMTKHDMQTVMHIEAESFPIAPWRNEASFLKGKQGQSYVVTDGEGSVVGYVVLKLSDRKPAAEVVIVKMAADPAKRRRGIGRFVLEWVSKYAARESAGCIFLRVRKANDPARTLYEQQGFKAERTVSEYYASGRRADERAAVEMRKNVP